MMANETKASSRELSVSALTANIQRLLEQNFSSLRVRGEVSRLTRHASGHIYFTVKDASAAISAVIWRSTAARLRCQPEEGGLFLFHGHLSVYAPRGSYQLVVRTVSPAGEGALALDFEQRKQAWAKRGWFDAGRKRPIPPYPQRIAIVTSPSSAAWQDVRKVLRNRPAWLHLILAPTQVQGKEAPAAIATAMRHAEKQCPDIILLVRGGGSMEDLWCFNDERVVRAIVDSHVPVITGIGHEIDLTLADLAADVRAATPSNAAEHCCADRETLARRIPTIAWLRQRTRLAVQTARQQAEEQKRRWQRLLPQILDQRHHRLLRVEHLLAERLAERLRAARRYHADITRRCMQQDPRRRLHEQRQRLRTIQRRMQVVPASLRQRQHQRYRATALRMQHHAPRLAPRQKALRNTIEMLYQQQQQRHAEKKQAWLSADRTLRALDPHRVLERGFVMVQRRDNGRRLITRAEGLETGDALRLRFADGTIEAEVS